MESKAPVVTLDGLSGAGKGTTGLKLAHHLKWHYLDSGVIYRLLALEAARQAIAPDNTKELVQLAHHIKPTLVLKDTSFETLALQVLWEEKDVTSLLRTEDCGLKASQLAANEQVRQALLKVQRSFQKYPGLITDGRDMGQVIFPLAQCKFFLTASIEARAKRRHEQLKQQGNYASLSTVKNAIVQRDKSDQTRIKATLQAIPKACVVDTTSLSVTQVVALIRKQLFTIGLSFH